MRQLLCFFFGLLRLLASNGFHNANLWQSQRAAASFKTIFFMSRAIRSPRVSTLRERESPSLDFRVLSIDTSITPVTARFRCGFHKFKAESVSTSRQLLNYLFPVFSGFSRTGTRKTQHFPHSAPKTLRFPHRMPIERKRKNRILWTANARSWTLMEPRDWRCDEPRGQSPQFLPKGRAVVPDRVSESNPPNDISRRILRACAVSFFAEPFFLLQSIPGCCAHEHI